MRNASSRLETVQMAGTVPVGRWRDRRPAIHARLAYFCVLSQVRNTKVVDAMSIDHLSSVDPTVDARLSPPSKSSHQGSRTSAPRRQPPRRSIRISTRAIRSRSPYYASFTPYTRVCIRTVPTHRDPTPPPASRASKNMFGIRFSHYACTVHAYTHPSIAVERISQLY